MRIGVISDTHGMLRPTVREAFRDVDRIIHCGDVGSPEILDRLALLAPVSAAYGNTDRFDVRNRSSKVVRLDCDGRNVIALHGDQFGMPNCMISLWLVHRWSEQFGQSKPAPCSIFLMKI